MNNTRKRIIKLLLSALNSRWLNNTPCEYGFIGNIDAFSAENLESEDHQQPGITVRQILDSAARFKACPMGHGLTVIDGDEVRDATVWDLDDLRKMGRR